MLKMQNLSRVASPSYEPLASSPAPGTSGYRDIEGSDGDAPLLPSSRSPTDSKRVPVQSNRRRLAVILGLSVLLLLGLTWSSGAGDAWAGEAKGELAPEGNEVAAGLTPGIIEEAEGEEHARIEDEWRPVDSPTTTEPTSSAVEEQAEEEGAREASDGAGEEVPEIEGQGDTATAEEASTEEDSTDDDSAEEEADSSTEVTAPSVPILNVRPHPRPPPNDPAVAEQMRYLSYENHSGFHNQRKSLSNALLIAHILNRTLLLPPARLGSTAPWEPTLETIIPFMERCKAGVPLPTDDPCSTSAHSDGNRWTYVGWSYLVSEKLLAGRQLVDRWNSSMEWMYEGLKQGGLGLSEKDIVKFEDPVRRSYQFYDDRSQPTKLGQFTQRINLEDLMEGDMAQAKLLHFGSMFSGGRTKISRKENIEEQQKLEQAMVFEIDKVDGISDAIRDALGSYVGVHLRVGDGVFKTKAHENMQGVFRKLCKTVFKMKRSQIDALLKDSASRPAPRSSFPRHRRHLGRRGQSPISWSIMDDVEEPLEQQSSFVAPSHYRRALKRDSPRPLSPTVRCRSALHTNPNLVSLNMPLYIATDSRSPLTDRNLAPFFHHFPCAFLVTDFASTESGLNQQPIPDLVEMVEGRWTSDWDGQGLANYLYPFLEAEVAAKGIAVVGTPQSTFSGYTAGVLHTAYREQGKTTEQVSGVPMSVVEDGDQLDDRIGEEE